MSFSLTIRLIRSFEFGNVKYMVLTSEVSPDMTVAELKALVLAKVAALGAFRMFRTMTLDTFKIYTLTQGAKTSNRTINLDRDADWILDDEGRTLGSYGIISESELSFFHGADYERYRVNPTLKWV
jgi:hypothetical protein